ncbi:MAG: hypothetical protein JWR80_831 [Bradyrhizobium sp.]|nr:hypothetical protein [Bradyrhizobium sp.]
MAASTKPRTAKRKNTKAGRKPANGAPILSMVARNLINMVVVSAVSGAVLLALLTARHF